MLLAHLQAHARIFSGPTLLIFCCKFEITSRLNQHEYYFFLLVPRVDVQERSGPLGQVRVEVPPLVGQGVRAE
jgi:hypothetical protein